jgi:hypothetical protein
VPLVCLGVPVGVLCLTEVEDEECLRPEEASVLRLLGMQISEFLAADPEVEKLLESAQASAVEGVEPLELVDALDGDAEIAQAICEAVANEVEPQRVLDVALSAVASRLRAAPVALYLRSRDGEALVLEAQEDGGVATDRPELPVDRGLLGGVVQTGRLVATEQPESEGRFDRVIDTAEDGLPRPALFVPIRLRDKAVGVLRVFLAEGAPASPRTAEVLSAAFSAAVRNVLLYRSLLQSIEEVAEARRSARGRSEADQPS